MANALAGNMFETFLNWLYQSGEISVPADYHERCGKIEEMLDNDISGTINSLLDYAVNSASEANYRVECSEPTLQKLLNLWLDQINIDIKGVPTGLQALSTEYFRERWEGSSFCILRAQDWEKISADNVTIEVPTTMWFVNGGSVYVARPKDKNYQLGSDKYFLDSENKIEIPSKKDEKIIVQKPYDRWYDQYPTPYLIRKGIYKNWLAMKTLQDKSDEVIAKILPYLFIIQKGTENLFLQEGVDYMDEELQKLADNFKDQLEKYRGQKGRTPTNVVPFDQKYDHLIPDLRNILTEELYRQGFRSILAGLGFIDMLEITPSRQEDRLNPKPFIAEVNNGVNGFKAILLEAIYLIEERNKSSHRKLFSSSGKIIVVNSPLKINTEKIMDAIRSGFDRGGLSIESYVETLGFDYTTEKEKRSKELDNGDEDLMYPHLIQSREDIPDRMGIPAKPKDTTKLEDQNKKKNTPETKTKTAGLEDELEIAPYKTNEDLPQHLQYLPDDAKTAFRETFNDVMKQGKGEDSAFPIAYNSMKRLLKTHGYKKNDKGKWIKE
jgi:cation transport regulator ChaB